MKRFRLIVLALLVAVFPAGLPGLAAGADIAAVTILQTSDLHNHASGYGPFLDYPDEATVVGGYARLATVINSVRGEGNDTLLLDSGDFLMGTPYDITDVTLQFFKMMNYDRSRLATMNLAGPRTDLPRFSMAPWQTVFPMCPLWPATWRIMKPRFSPALWPPA